MTNSDEQSRVTEEIVSAMTGGVSVPGLTTVATEAVTPPPTPAVEEAEARARKAEAEARKAIADVEKLKVRKGTKDSPLSKFVGSPEAIKILKVREDGNTEFISKYRWDEVKGFSDVESFIDARLRETWGDGIYRIVYVKTDGTESNPVDIGMARPQSFGRSPMLATPNITPKDLLQAQRDMREDLRKEQERTDARVNALLTQAKAEGGAMAPLIGAVIETMKDSNRRTADMLERRMNTPIPTPPSNPNGMTGDLLVTFMKENRDREKDMELERERIRSDERKFQLQLEESRRQADAALRERELKWQEQVEAWRREDREKEEQFRREDREKDRIHALELAKLQQSQIKDPIEELTKFMTAQEKLQGLLKTETNWMDLGSAFIENLPSLAEKIGKAIGDAKGGRVAPPQRTALAGAQRGAGTLPPAAPEQGVPTLSIPDGFAPYVSAMNEAKDDATRVFATINALSFLRKHEDWEPHVNNLLMTVLAPDGEKAKKKALEELKAFLALLARTTPPLVPGEVAGRIVTSLEQNWEIICKTVRENIVGGGTKQEEKEEDEDDEEEEEEEKR